MKKIITSLCIVFSIFISGIKAQIWDPLSTGLGISGETVKAIAVDGAGNIYAGGTFTGAINYIAKWPAGGSAWVKLGTVDLDGPVFAITVKALNDVYVGGAFTMAGTTTLNHIARWDNSSFSALGSGLDGNVNCIFLENFGAGTIFAGGSFINSGTTTLNRVGKWQNNTWIALGSGVSSTVNAITENGGFFVGTDDQTNPVKKFDGTAWSNVTGLSSGKVYSLASYNNELYAGGDFTSPTPAASKYDATNSTWNTIQTQFNVGDKIYAMYVRNGVLYLGGKFNNLGINNKKSSFVAKKTTTNNPIQSITDTSSKLNDEVYAISSQGDGKLIVGGKFTVPNHIARTSFSVIGIDEISNIVVNKNFYPNPVNSTAHLTITTTVHLLKPELKIYDLQSRLLTIIHLENESTGKEINFSFDCSAFPKGNYYYVLSEDGKSVLSDPFIVE
jgi:hypothetical protein